MSHDAVSVSGACRFVPVVSTLCDDGGREFVPYDQVEPPPLIEESVICLRVPLACLNL